MDLRQATPSTVLQPAAGADELLRMLIQGDGQGAWAIVAAASAFDEFAGVATRWVQPALCEIGRMWQRGEITVAEEHVASAVARGLLVRLAAGAPRHERNGRRALFACVEGNTHSIGSEIVCSSFDLAGWSVRYLGSDTPAGALIPYVEQWRPDVVGLSVSMVQQLPTLQRVVRCLRQRFGERRPKVVVGGLASNQLEGAWRWIGADHWSPDPAIVLVEEAAP